MSDIQSPFLSNSWLENCGTGGFVFNEKCALYKTSLKGVSAIFTPPWALDCGLTLKLNDGAHYSSFIEELKNRPEKYLTVDLPPCSNDLAKGLNTALVKQYTPSDFRIQWRHTRISSLPATLPSNRRKQVKKAEREGISCEVVSDWKNVKLLHEESRNRKDLESNIEQLETLLDGISKEDFTFAIEALNKDGECLASGGFVLTNTNRCIYSFGGQKRGPLSAVSTVAMLAFAMEVAQEKGALEFDFGGSTDPGVDRFYKEFGAKRIPKPRLIRTAWWLSPILKVLRPDLS